MRSDECFIAAKKLGFIQKSSWAQDDDIQIRNDDYYPPGCSVSHHEHDFYFIHYNTNANADENHWFKSICKIKINGMYQYSLKKKSYFYEIYT